MILEITCILIASDYFFDFMPPNEIHHMVSGFYVILTKVGPTITGSGYISKFRSYNENQTKKDIVPVQN